MVFLGKLGSLFHRRIFAQFFFFFLQNPLIGNFFSGQIYQGDTKRICTPGLNCYSCPAAVTSCPIGATQLFLSGARHNISLFVAGFLLTIGVFFGRFICGYVCPMGLIQDLIHKIKTPKLNLKLRFARYIKYVVLVLFVFTFPLLFLNEYSGLGSPWFCKYICPSGTVFAATPILLSNDFLRNGIGTLFFWKLSVAVALISASVFIYRFFCRVLCPLGAIYALFNPISVVRMGCDRSKCSSCGICRKACNLGINPVEQPNSPECVRCGKCVKKCNSDALEYYIGLRNCPKIRNIRSNTLENITKMVEQLSKEFTWNSAHVENVIKLIDEGNTIPFIARYRKELHGTMDDGLLRDLADRLQYLRSLNQRRGEIIASIDGQGKLTDELKQAIESAQTLAKLEDIYRPYKQKRRTRATIAREKGLEPLAELIFAQELKEGNLVEIASAYIDTEKGVETAEEALQGANDIIAEDISDNAEIRELLRELIKEHGILISSAAKTAEDGVHEDSVYRLYYEFNELLSKLQSHRTLAINRGEKEKFLKVSVDVDTESALKIIKKKTLKHNNIFANFVASAVEDSYTRLIFPSLEREMRNDLTDSACLQAIKMFAVNLKPTLMQPPVKNMVTMGFDPAYRTGCKIAVVDETGKLLETGVVYPTMPHNKVAEAKSALTRMIKKHKVIAIAIGNGTASKESEIFVSDLLKESPELSDVSYIVVNEAGASVYSASKLAATEFPELDVSLRSAVSIARRLQDPLAELVKIDPKSIGVGQYQHDMPVNQLDSTLSDVIEDCVNAVGVDMNTASPALLSYVSGLSATTANNIVKYREENGKFSGRSQIKKIPKIGPKAFEQCAGFLRIPESKNILDNTGVHPESYKAAEKILEICGYSLKDVGKGGVRDLKERLKNASMSKVAEYSGIGIPTVTDIVNELLKPGRDPRDELPPTMLRTDVMDMKDLKPGMVLKGTVRNVIDFGAFVDIGVHQDGLVHVSEIANRFIKHPSDAVTVGDIVDAKVLSVDAGKKRISLSIKQASQK